MDGGITPYQLPWIVTRFIALKDYLMMMIGRTGGVALLEKAFATDDYSKEDLQYVADVLRHCSRKTIWRTFDSCNNYNDSAQKTPAVRKNVRGMNAPITNNATIIPTGFSSGIVGFSWPDVLQNAVIRCIALLFQEKHFR